MDHKWVYRRLALFRIFRIYVWIYSHLVSPPSRARSDADRTNVWANESCVWYLDVRPPSSHPCCVHRENTSPNHDGWGTHLSPPRNAHGRHHWTRTDVVRHRLDAVWPIVNVCVPPAPPRSGYSLQCFWRPKSRTELGFMLDISLCAHLL